MYVMCWPNTMFVAGFAWGEQQYSSDLKIDKNPTVVFA